MLQRVGSPLGVGAGRWSSFVGVLAVGLDSSLVLVEVDGFGVLGVEAQPFARAVDDGLAGGTSR